MSLKETLAKLGGNLSFSHVSISDKTHHLHILLQNKDEPTIVCAMLLQHKPVNHDITNPTTIFIEGLDTTGNFHPRKYQSTFTKAFVVEILKNYNPFHLSCFAYPKESIIFCNSEKNEQKKCLDAKNLCEYWIEIFKKYNENNKLYVYSNYHLTKSVPYTKNDKILLFNDDPINKLSDHIKNNCNVHEIFEILQYKTDFSKGSLIYSIGKEATENNKEYENTNLSEMLNFLRQNDFSNTKESIKNTNEFIKKYKISLEWFITNETVIEKQEKKITNTVIKLNTRKKNVM
ncbi:hypothetical protein BDAP_002211 [Binucleata daphniae]